MNKLKLLGILILFCAMAPQACFAYLDPGTGSMVIQIIVASVAAIGVFLKSFWAQIKTFFNSVFNKGESENNEEQN